MTSILIDLIDYVRVKFDIFIADEVASVISAIPDVSYNFLA